MCYDFMILNSLWPSDAICWLRSGSTLAQVMASCWKAPGHYLNQCWPFIKGVLWHLIDIVNSTAITEADMMTSSNGNIFRVTDLCAGNSPVIVELPHKGQCSQRPMTHSFDVFFDLCLNKQLSKQSWGWWFETPLCSLWRHCNGTSVKFDLTKNTLAFSLWATLEMNGV